MPDDRLPIVFKGSARNALLVFAVGAAMLVAGLIATREQMGQLIGVHPGPRLPLPVAGWFLLGCGALIAPMGLTALLRGCPRLELTAQDIVFSRCWRGPIRVAWRELDRVEVRRFSRPSAAGDAGFESLALIRTNGSTQFVGGLGPVGQARDAIARIATGMRAAPSDTSL
jgi:hypothetical protein